MNAILRCPVRGCAESLLSQGSRWTCAQGHAFDHHRSGCLNLLQPQDRRSKQPGDSREVAAARRRLLGKGYGAAVHQALAQATFERRVGRPSVLLDVGCGEGGLLRSLQPLPGLELHGLDISAPSLHLAAKAAPGILFVVANADRFIPYADGSIDVVTSLDARANPEESHRILTPGGLALIAVPAPDDLIELRERIQGARVEKTRTNRVEEGFNARFDLDVRLTVREQRVFDPSELRDLLATSYRGYRSSERAAVDALTAMSVTLSHEILVFVRKVAG